MTNPRDARRTVSWVVLCVGLFLARTASSRAPVFEADVLPVLKTKCGMCHGSKVRKGDLDLSSMNALRRGGESGEPLVAATIDDSLLWTMIDGGDMPPAGQPPLTADERNTIRDWIEHGAKSHTPAESSAESVDQHDVLPIVLLRCATCHGARLQQGGLDLRTPASMRRGGNSGPAFVAGKPEASLMISRIESEACPPQKLLLKYFVRRPARAEVETLRQWIAAGAPATDVAPDVATHEPDPLVTEEERRHWSLQPIHRAGVQKYGSVDELIERQLQQHDLSFSPPADRDTLIRRAAIDLLGMPPDRATWQKWRNSQRPDWYESMIDEFLASPHYGERWGRYWLDIAGYADSEGGVSADPIRRVAWKYRDYVIRAFNEDKPYDRFLLEQIAGDELLDYQGATAVTDERVDNLVATGFLRMGIDQTGSRTMNFVPERLGVIDDVIRVLGSGVMGLTLECARCHSHKYDPIPQRDYYRFKAIFQGALDEHDWLTFKNRRLELATPAQKRRLATINPPLERELKRLESQRAQAVADARRVTLRTHYPDQADADREATLRALRIADNNRTQPQRILVEMLRRAEVVPEANQPQPVLAARESIRRVERQQTSVRRKMVPPATIRALWDRGEPSPTYLLRRGEHDKPGKLVGPGVPSALTDGRTPFVVRPPFPGKTGRRLAFARWLIRPDHPLTARVMVNRIWYHHFGTGLVKSLENFGTQGERPSHPELLDWLATRFVDSGWSVKAVHRLIMNSRTFRQTSRITDERRDRDPQNRWLSRMPLRRLDAEALRDSLLFVSGMLDDSPGGPPDPVSVDRNGQVSAEPTESDRWRRSVYMQYRRTEIPTMMNTFDYPVMGPNCVTRSVSTVVPQSLMLMNNARVHQLSAAFARRITARSKEDATSEPVGLDSRQKATIVYQTALSRSPTDRELALGAATLDRLNGIWRGDERAALTTFCHTILNSAAFLYVD